MNALATRLRRFCHDWAIYVLISVSVALVIYLFTFGTRTAAAQGAAQGAARGAERGAAQGAARRPASDPAAVAILERHQRATGTAAEPEFQHAITEMQFGPGAAFRLEVFMARPDRLLVRTLVGGDVMMEFGFDGTRGWTSTPMAGVVPLEGAALDSMRAGTSMITTPSIDSTARLVALGRSTLDGQAVDGLLAIDAQGDTVEGYYSVSTGLLAGARMRGAAGAPDGASLVLFREYKRLAGRMLPTVMVFRLGDQEGTARTVHVDFERIDDARFRAPSGRLDHQPHLIDDERRR